MSDPTKTIIVVDDDEHDLDYLTTCIRNVFPGYRVLGFPNEQALAESLGQLGVEDVHLAIVDAILGPLSRGRDVLAYFKRAWPHVRRVLISNKASLEDVESAINHCTPDAFLYKREPLLESSLDTLRELLAVDRATFPISSSRALKLLADLGRIKVGEARYGNMYRTAIADILSYLFYPALRSPRQEVRLNEGTMAADIVFYNAAQQGILRDQKATPGSLQVVVEVKNRRKLTPDCFRQIGAYLDAPTSKCGFVVFRGEITPAYLRHIQALRSKGKQVFLLCETELVDLVRRKASARSKQTDFWETMEDFLVAKFVAA